jgi:4-amino-4-deoxy-L-arabinose transferase-like glycosyltransferase
VPERDEPSRTPHSGEAIRPPSPPGRESVLIFVLVLVTAAVTLYHTADRPLFTAHEARAACVARNMLESAAWPADRPDPWLVPQFSADAESGLNYQKPPLYYWAVAAVSGPLGRVTNLTVRLPSAVSMILLVVITYYLGKAVVSRRAGLLAALVILSTPKLLWWSRAAILDPMLVACVAGSILFFYRAHRGLGGRWQYWLFWALAGLGTLVKATSLVIPLMAAGLYILSRVREDGLWAQVRALKPVSGPLVLLAVAAPWHVAAHVATGGEFSRIYWGIHVFGRATGTSVFEDNTDPWFYLAVLPRDLFPWIVFLPGALVQPWRAASREHRSRLMMPWLWFVGALVFFSAISFRKDEYMMVAFPAAAVLIGYFLDYFLYAHADDAALRRWVESAFWIVAVCTVLVAGGLVAIAVCPPFRDWLFLQFHNATDRATFHAVADLVGERWPVALALAGPMIAGAVASIVCIRKDRPAPAIGLTVCTTLLAFVLFVDLIVPVLGRARGLADFAITVDTAAERQGENRPVYLAFEECHELAFLLHRGTRSLAADPDGLVEFLRRERARGRRWLVVMDRKTLDAGRWTAPDLEWREVVATPPLHRRPMVLVEPVWKEGMEPSP